MLFHCIQPVCDPEHISLQQNLLNSSTCDRKEGTKFNTIYAALKQNTF